MYTCIKSIRTSNGESYKFGEEISDYTYNRLSPSERNHFRVKPSEGYDTRVDDDDYVAPSMPDYTSGSYSSTDDLNSDSDLGGGGSFGGGGSSDSW